MFVGRKSELAELERRYAADRKEFGVVYGRRRIGKTELIRHFAEGKKGIIFQAKQDSSYGNLKSFSYTLNKLTGLPSSFVYSSWLEALDAVKQAAGNERFLFIIDEYPYIVSQDDSFPSVLQEFVDTAPSNFFIILMGSDVSFLKKELKDKKSPLYKRRTFEMQIFKMPFSEVKQFLENMSDEDKVRYIALMATYPYYLAAIDSSVSFEENMIRLLFNQYGTFFDLPDQILSNSTKKQDMYNAILNSISHRHYSLTEISQDIHEETGKVSKYLTTLLNSEIVEKRTTFMGNKKSNYYAISDPMIRFWYSFVFEEQERIRINGEAVFREESENIYNFLNKGFEDVSILYLEQLNRDGRLPGVFPKIQNFRADHTALGRSVEIDGMSRDGSTLLVVECKYRNTVFTEEMLNHLKESDSIFPSKLSRVYYIFSKTGFDEAVLKEPHVHCIDLHDLWNYS
ncbi:MAG: ATP-binding protein [Bulleidia sp.]|nr:ATP-binding protein [Bulleidia sp.]